MITKELISKGLFKLRFKALGSPCLIQFRASEVDEAKAFGAASLGWLRTFEQTWSRFKPDSLLSKINSQAGGNPVAVTQEEEQLLDICDHVHRLSNGICDPTIHPLTRMWDEAAELDQILSDTSIEKTLSLVGWDKVEREKGLIRLPLKGMALDFGGFGKEYAVDQVRRIALEFGIHDALIDLGRDITSIGRSVEAPYWIVGIENPHTPDQGTFRIRLNGNAIASSGGSRRFRVINGVRHSHHIDPRTGNPSETDVIAASCVANDCLTAGVFARNACILGADEALAQIQQFPGVEGLVQTARSVRLTTKFHQHVLPI